MREELASLCHEQWSGWMKYLFGKSKKNDDGTVTIPLWAVDRWGHQMNTRYEDLSELEQESDRNEADRFITLLRDLGKGNVMEKQAEFGTIKQD